AAVPDRPDGMDDVAGREVPGTRGLRVAGRAAAEAAALLHDRRPAGTVDGAVDAPAAAQAAVRGVHDRVHRARGETAVDELEAHIHRVHDSLGPERSAGWIFEPRRSR